MTRQPGKIALRVVIVSLVVILIIGYSLFQARNLMRGPELYITSPTLGGTVHSPLVTIAGTADNISFITLNDRQIFVNSNGNFNEQLLLAPGYNVWTLSAKDKFGRIVSKKIELVLD